MRPSRYVLVLLLLIVLSELLGTPRCMQPEGPAGRGGLIRLTGQLLESGTGRPIAHASVMVQAGDQVLAHKESDINGRFVLLVPEEKWAASLAMLKIRYRGHTFIQNSLEPASQQIQVEIQRCLLLDLQGGDQGGQSRLNLSDPSVGKVGTVVMPPGVN